MRKRRTDRQLVRIALSYAIEARADFLACVADDPGSADAAERTRTLIAEWTALLARRYGERPAMDVLAEQMAKVPSVNIATLAAGSSRQFQDPATYLAEQTPLTSQPPPAQQGKAP